MCSCSVMCSRTHKLYARVLSCSRTRNLCVRVLSYSRTRNLCVRVLLCVLEHIIFLNVVCTLIEPYSSRGAFFCQHTWHQKMRGGVVPLISCKGLYIPKLLPRPLGFKKDKASGPPAITTKTSEKLAGARSRPSPGEG